MAPTQVREPFHRDGCVYEEKVDGWRILAYKDGASRPPRQPQRSRPYPTLRRHRVRDRQLFLHRV
jgi:hypothetical protein